MFRPVFRYVLPVVAIAVMGVSTVYAKPAIDDAGAEKLKQQVTAALETRRMLANIDGQRLSYTGEITVTPQEKFYQVRLPEMTGTIRNAHMRLGRVVINAAPQGGDRYAISMALPAHIHVYDVVGEQVAQEPTLTLSTGKQNFAAVWHANNDTLTKIDATYRGMKIETKQGLPALQATIGSVAIKKQLSPDKTGSTWSGTENLAVSDVSIALTLPAEGDAASRTTRSEMTFKQFTTGETYGALHIDNQYAARQKLAVFLKENEKNPAVKNDKIFEDMAKVTLGSLNNYAQVASLQDMTFKQSAAATPSEMKTLLRVAEATSESAVTDLTAEKGNARFKTSFKGVTNNLIAGEGMNKLIARALPEEGNIDLHFTNLPTKALAEFTAQRITQQLQDALGDQLGTTDESAAVAARLKQAQTWGNMPRLFAESGAKVEIRDTYLKAPDLTVLLSGSMQPNTVPGAVPVAGEVTMMAGKFDQFLQNMEQFAPQNPHIVPVLQILTMVQLLGETRTVGDESYRAYKIEFTPEGAVKLNGGDIGSFMKMLPPR